MIEWESTISIAISEEEFIANTNGILSFLNPLNRALEESTTPNPSSIDVLILYRNGVRFSSRQLERKVTTNCRNLLSFYHNHWYTIKRTTATETPVDATNCKTDASSFNIEKVIFRYIKLNENGVRVSYNREENDMGCKYMVEYEVEYSANSTYAEILQAERKLMQMIHLNVNHRHMEKEQLTLETVFSCVMSKVQMWHCFDANCPYVWAYKWNGVKAKILITNTATITPADANCDTVGFLTYLWPDASSVETMECHGPNNIISSMQNLCLSVEILDDRIVVLEVIGALMNDTIYTTEPATNVSILKYFRKKMNSTSELRLGTKPLIFQEFFDTPLPSTYNLGLHDGFVICQNDMIIKWKIPTIDVKCIGPYTFTVAGETINTEQMPDSIECEVGKIYEMSFKNEILRQRNDRIAPSSQQEYKIFLESAKNLT